MGDNMGLNQRSTGSLPTVSAMAGDVAWGAASRAQSTERQPTYRQASPTPRTRPPALASPGVPMVPQHLQQAVAVGQQTPTTAGYRALHNPSSMAGPAQPQAQPYGSATGRAVTPRSHQPVQMISAPAAAWQASGPGLVAGTPRGISPFDQAPKQPGSGSFVAAAPPVGQVPKQQGSGSFVAAAPGVGQVAQQKPQGSGSFVAAPPSHKPSTVHGFTAGACPQRAASGPSSTGPLATQPAVTQMSPPQGSGQVARLRQGSPLSRSRTVEWTSQASAQPAPAYARPHSAWGHM